MDALCYDGNIWQNTGMIRKPFRFDVCLYSLVYNLAFCHHGTSVLKCTFIRCPPEAKRFISSNMPTLLWCSIVYMSHTPMSIWQ